MTARPSGSVETPIGPGAPRSGSAAPPRLSPSRLALESQTVEIAFTSAGHQRLGWEWVLGRALRSGPLGVATLPQEMEGRAVQTHPVLAGLAWGPALALALEVRPAVDDGSARSEPRVARREVPAPGPERAWTRALGVLAPLVASIGDRIFHFALPLGLSSGLVFLGLHFGPRSVFWYPIPCAALVGWIAVLGWRVGLRGEEAVLELLTGRRLERSAQLLESASRLLLGLVLGMLLVSAGKEGGPWALCVFLISLAGSGILAWKRGLPPLVRLGLLLVLGVLFGRWWG